jgi:hypothetical protein
MHHDDLLARLKEETAELAILRANVREGGRGVNT